MPQAPDPAEWNIPNYRLIKRVGRGAFGEVWLAEEVLTRICRAVKIIRGGSTSKSTHRRTELDGVREYQQRSRGHPHLIQVLTVGETEDALYYVMEAADNALGSRVASLQDYEPSTLAGVLAREGRLSLDAALEHVTSTLAGIEHLHTSGLTHRDLKPSNVLFVDGVLKLADVGLASRDARGSVGTPGYRTPDGAPDDLYAIGVMLYEMITGQGPSRFPEIPADLDRAHDPRHLKEVLRLIDRACHPEPTQRFESATQFAAAVRRAGLAPRIRVKRRAWGFVVAALLAIIVILGWLVRAWPQNLEWVDVCFVEGPTYKQATPFPHADHHEVKSGFRLDAGVLGRDANLLLTGEFDVGYDRAGCVMALMLAVDDEIVHLIYYGKPREGGHRNEFKNRIFHLRNDLLNRFRGNRPVPVYVVVQPTDDFFGFCQEYAASPAAHNRILIGHIERTDRP